MDAASAIVWTLLAAFIGWMIGYPSGKDSPSEGAIDRILCEDRCATAHEKLLTVTSSRECICTTVRVALPGRSVQ